MWNTKKANGSTPTATRRRGVASVMAMLYLMIFSALALGFYGATTTSGQVAQNERTSLSAQLAAESGIQFLRYHLSALDIKAGLTANKLFEEVYQQLATRLDGTANLGGSNVGYDGRTISIPETGYVNIDSAGKQRFRVTLTLGGDILVARVVGRGGTITLGRGVEIKFQKANNATAIFNYGVASRGTVSTSGASTVTGLTDPTKGSILSTNTSSGTPVSIMGKEVSGDISTVSPTANVQFGSNTSIGGTSNTSLIRSQHIHKGIDEPRFPDVDTDVYKQYATNVYTSGKDLTNAIIPANTNPTFNGGANLKGVIYVEAPNVVTFRGNTTIQGVIVVQNNAPLDTTKNVIDFSGNVSASPIETLPASFGDVRKLTGAFLIAPNFRVRMWGNFGQVGGSIIASQFQMGGSAEGTVKGSIIQTNDLPTTIDGSADVIIASVGTTQYPAGVTFGVYYTSVPGSYMEVPVSSGE